MEAASATLGGPRSALKGAVGVLYPDVSKMTTFEARY